MDDSRRYVIVGAGSVGGTIGARLALAGNDVAFVARGEHGRAIAREGLRFLTPSSDDRVRVPVFERVEDVTFAAGDILVLAVKTQDTDPILESLVACAPPELPIVCAQNGVDNERRALRLFADLHGMCVFMQGEHLEPGVVLAYGRSYSAILDIGRFPRGRDATDERVARDCTAAGLVCEAVPDVMQIKYAKLLTNLANVIEAASGANAWRSQLMQAARAEALRCYAAAGIVAGDGGGTPIDLSIDPGAIGTRHRGGGSTWQSLARGSGSLETDALNGEIVLLGRLHGVPTPANAFLQNLGRRLVRERPAAGSIALADLERAFQAVVAPARG